MRTSGACGPTKAARGPLRAGAAADLVLFNADQLADRTDYGQPCEAATGIAAVWVNGALALEAGTPPARAGRVLGHASGRRLG